VLTALKQLLQGRELAATGELTLSDCSGRPLVYRYRTNLDTTGAVYTGTRILPDPANGRDGAGQSAQRWVAAFGPVGARLQQLVALATQPRPAGVPTRLGGSPSCLLLCGSPGTGMLATGGHISSLCRDSREARLVFRSLPSQAKCRWSEPWRVALGCRYASPVATAHAVGQPVT